MWLNEHFAKAEIINLRTNVNDSLSSGAVIRRFFGDVHIMHMGLFHT